MDSMLVKDYMTRNLVTLRPDMEIVEAVSILSTKRVPGAPVVDQLGNFVGILLEKDCLNAVLNAVYYEERGGMVENFMKCKVEVVDAEDNIIDTAKRIIDTGYRGMPVLNNHDLVGMINRSDILKAILRFCS